MRKEDARKGRGRGREYEERTGEVIMRRRSTSRGI